MVDRAKMTAMAAGAVMVVVLIAIVSGMMTPLRDQGDDLRNTPCENAGGVWNTTDHICQNATAPDQETLTNFTHYSLSAQFYGRNGGSAFIVILGAILIGAVIWWLRRGS